MNAVIERQEQGFKTNEFHSNYRFSVKGPCITHQLSSRTGMLETSGWFYSKGMMLNLFVCEFHRPAIEIVELVQVCFNNPPRFLSFNIINFV